MRFIVIGVCVILFLLGCDLMTCLSREFEHNIDDSKVEGGTEPPQHEYHSMIATAYCLTGKTATGTTPRPGIAASRPEWYGKTARVYWNDGGEPGSLIGEYVIEDTGSRNIKRGRVIDIWLESEQKCIDFGRRLVLVEILD